MAAAEHARLGARGGWEPGGTEAALQIADGLAVLTGGQREVGRNSLSSCEQLALALGADEALAHLALVEHEQRGDAHHVEPHREVGVLVDVELGDGELAGCSAAISSRMGAIILHGPHHSAQKSTTTGLSLAADGLVEGGRGEGDDAIGHGGGPFAGDRDVTARPTRADGMAIPPACGERGVAQWPTASSQRSASMAAMQPEPAAVMAWR